MCPTSCTGILKGTGVTYGRAGSLPVKKPMQLSKDYHVAGELEGAKAPLEIQIIAIKKRLRYQTF